MLVIDQLKQNSKGFDDKKMNNLASKFNTIVKVLLNIGAGMSKSNEFEDIFEDIEEKICDIFLKMGINENDIRDFFASLCQTFGTLLERLTFTRHKQRFTQTWSRYIDGMRDFALHMFLVKTNTNAPPSSISPSLHSSFGVGVEATTGT
jgi:hypothetical protein